MKKNVFKNENLYLAYVRSELEPESGFFDFKKIHDAYIKDNVWSETDQMLAIYALVKAVLKADVEKKEVRAAAMNKVKNVQAEYARRML